MANRTAWTKELLVLLDGPCECAVAPGKVEEEAKRRVAEAALLAKAAVKQHRGRRLQAAVQMPLFS